MSKAADRRSKFEKLRALRGAGKKAFDTYEVEDAGQLYEEVDENQYKKIVRDRLNQDDFVVDDNGEGYADDGREEWDRAHVYESDSEEELVTRKAGRKSTKNARDDDQAKRDAKDRDISDFFAKGVVKAQPKPKIAATEEDTEFMASLLNDVDTNIPTALPPLKKNNKRSTDQRKARDLSPSAGAGLRQPLPKRAKMVDGRASPSHVQYAHDDNDDDDLGPVVHSDANVLPSDDIPMSDPMPSSPTVQVASRKEMAQRDRGADEPKEKITTIKEEEDEDDAMMEVAHAGAVTGTAASVNLTAARPVIKKPLKTLPYPTPDKSSPARKKADTDDDDAVDASAWRNLNQKLNVMSSPQSAEAPPTNFGGKLDHHDALEEDGSLRFFWLDYMEMHGSLCLFGKVLDKKTRKYVSCFVKVDNIQRKLFFLPRKHRATASGSDTGEEISMADVYAEVDGLMTKMGVQQHKTKPCTRKYAFELPGIPKEGRYLKLLYPYSKLPLPEGGGETYSHVFGTSTALFEQFVLWKNIMGPCWLQIEDANFQALKNSSHCKLEVLVEHPNMVSTMGDGSGEASEAPPLTLMSVAMRTVYNAAAKRQEILAISARIYDSVSLGDTTPAEKLACRTFTAMRPSGESFPMGFEALTRDKSRHRGQMRLMKQEAEILSYFLAQVAAVDPDVIIGHQLEGVDYSVLLSRMRELKTPNWSRLGRLWRKQWPGTMGRGSNSTSVFAERQVVSGRLLCDLSNDAGRSVMFKCQSWTLTEMVSLYLSGSGDKSNAHLRRDVDSEAALRTWARTKEGLLDYVGHLEADTYFIAALALRVQILPLTKVLTNLAGNSWARTLTGTRAERNEYILLHEFHRNKYICPDKPPPAARGGGRGGGRMAEGRENDNDEAGGGSSSKKKDKYKGGLVFEPERGLYDKFVLVMDFNSLYPSIIQEFNICFTTVDRHPMLETAGEDAEDVVPEVPVEQEQGVLPRLIATLVSRRRQVKALMKDKTATPEQLATWDIRQLALKLTANSMYGCLGYTQSRFYARPLAVLVTYKGREILRSTKELAESKALQVIYGDTDSVMINANVDNVAEALRVGEDFKRTVNERYRLLEIDIDNVFRRILLQAKKKYAAINLIEAPGGKYVEKMEVKGLDMRRREYCALSKEMSTRILQEILSGDETEVSVTRIHAYLREMAARMRGKPLEGQTDEAEASSAASAAAAAPIPTAKYVIYTQLGKDPTDYPNAESMPQVQVALRELQQGRRLRKGDVVSYVIATGETAPTSEPAPKRAYTLADVQRKDSGLQPDVEWYLGKQIFPPVERLCANIVGTSTAQLAENLGLDIRRYASGGGSGANSGSNHQNGDGLLDMHPLESQIPDAVRFRDCTRLQLRCRRCKATGVFEGLQAAADESEESEESKESKDSKNARVTVTPGGLACGHCGATLPTLSVVAQIEHAVRVATTRYYEGWLVCDDASCGMRTRQMSVYGTRCLGPKGLARDCLGRMRYEVGERDMYNQLVYYASLFDVEKAKMAAAEVGQAGRENQKNQNQNSMQQERIRALAEHNRIRFRTMGGAVDQYLVKCGRRWVAMDTLFAKLGFPMRQP